MKKIYFLLFVLTTCIGICSAQLVVADKTGWSIIAYDLQDAGDPATNVIDGNYGTKWHTPWNNSETEGYPHYIEVDMGQIYTSIPAFLYLARQDDSGNGQVKGYNLYFKVNSDDVWSSPISGELANTKDIQSIDLSGQNINARYFKFEATSPQNSSEFYASAAELGIAVTMDVTKKYNLKLSGENFYLQQKQVVGAEDNGDFSLQTLISSDETFDYTFIPVVGKACVYNIFAHNNYMKISGGWKCVLENLDLTNPKNNQFVIEKKNDTYLFRPLGRDNMSNNKCIGLDGSVINNRIYGDKDPVQWAYWELVNGRTIAPIVESKYPADNETDIYYRDLVVRVSFNRAITLTSAASINVINSLNQQVNILSVAATGNVLTLTMNPLALNMTYTVNVPVGAIDDYDEVISWSFTTANLTMPTEGIYNVINTNAGYYLTYPDIAPKDDSPLSVSSSVYISGDDEKRQEFQFIIPDVNYPDVFNIKENLTDSYLYLYQGHWRSGLSVTNPGTSAKFVLISDDSNYKIKAISNYANNDFFAPDNDNDGVGCYLNKQSRNTWQLIKKRDVPTSEKTVSETSTNVYPTLSNGKITVETQLPANTKIMDVFGKILAVYSSQGQMGIDLNYTDGLYLVMVKTVEGESLHKILLKK